MTTLEFALQHLPQHALPHLEIFVNLGYAVLSFRLFQICLSCRLTTKHQYQLRRHTTGHLLVLLNMGP